MYLGSNCYPKTLAYLKDCRRNKNAPKSSCKRHPLLPETEGTVMFAYFGKLVLTNCVSDGRYRCTNRPIPIIGKMANNRPIPIVGRLLVHL